MHEVIDNPEDIRFPIAIIVRKEYDGEHDFCHFLTPSDAPLQLGVQRRPKGWGVKQHFHLQQNRYVQQTMETVFLQSGTMKVDLYYLKRGETPTYLCTRTLHEGDVIHLMYGGHAFRLQEETPDVVAFLKMPCRRLTGKNLPLAGKPEWKLTPDSDAGRRPETPGDAAGRHVTA